MTEPSRPSQWQVIRSDKWLLSCLTWLPVVLALLIWWIFSEGIARDLPIGVVALESSQLSRQLSRELDASPTLAIQTSYPSVAAAKQAMVEGSIYAYVVIPRHFERDIYQNNPPEVSVFYNSQYILVGKLINSAASRTLATFSAQVGSVKQLAKGNSTMTSAIGKAVTLRSQITPLFNKNGNYAQFLVSAIVPALWTIFIMVTTILVLAANLRLMSLETLIGKGPIRSLLSLGSFYFPLFLLQGIAFVLWFYVWLGWPMAGSFTTLLMAQGITVVSCMLMGAFFFFMTLDPARALSFAGAYSAPSFAFMGVTFPATDMNTIAQFWRSLLPAAHYIQAQISQVSFGASSWQTISAMSPMLGYLLPFVLTLLLIRKHQAKLAVAHDPI